MHSAGIARIALLIGRVRCLPRSSRHGGTPGERQDDEEHGKPSPKCISSLPAPDPVSLCRATKMRCGSDDYIEMGRSKTSVR